ncbi:calcium-translocating P-type ATPase, PMCA-type [Anaerotalea alkaliphila]|uniref:P-type Ca(2+) transporter n=1 Tax=Anaerotalea alkaliphila TaxID=2662126 RepID=A0A7X5HTD7_9FIRM|nr:calcium-translocating P-type ATPase, PMCA-type [Anaerotalea alkaliphila]NDL66205.1 calcium-translocating P-type ATPase, PMCA-type [Anaerotalea alkaliphila]
MGGGFHGKTIGDLEAAFSTDRSRGLGDGQVCSARDTYGWNKLLETEGRKLHQMVLEQLGDVLILLLLAASVLSYLVGEKVDAMVIVAIVVLNTVLGVVQERKAGKALEELKRMAAPKAKVVRGGELSMVEAAELVPGDLVVLETGDYVPADLRVTESVLLEIDESALTGESAPAPKEEGLLQEKDLPVGDRSNMAHMGTVVSYGRGKGIVVAVGMETEIGKIATLLNETVEEKTPLQLKLARLGRMIGALCVLVCMVILWIGIYRQLPLLEVFMTAVALAVAAIPEGLPAVVAVVLAIGVTRMVSQNAIMKNLGAVETLGATTVICSDKTGTLTQNSMTVRQVQGSRELLLLAGVLCNDAQIREGKVVGDPTEGALLTAGAKEGLDRDRLHSLYPRQGEIPFDGKRKMMSTLHRMEEGWRMYTKGAPDLLVDGCDRIQTPQGIRPLAAADREEILADSHAYAEQALRVLGFAMKDLGEKEEMEGGETGMVFLGLVGMMDPPRKEAKEAVEICRRAGIRPVMITGDHIATACAIGKELGILVEGNLAMDGKTLDGMDQVALEGAVRSVGVFARVSPEHKVRIVDALKANGEIVAMTGDGVNDAPALKRADIGIAMGITGTDVTKEAADMILTDDNFSSIVSAVGEGRVIYSNIRKFVGFLLSCNIGEILIILVAMLAGWPVPLLPIQLLWINLITDSLPAFALGLEKKEAGVMDQAPREPDVPIVDRAMGLSILVQSLVLPLGALGAYRLGTDLDGVGYGRTLCFATLILGEMFRAYSARSEHAFLHRMRPLENRYLNGSVAAASTLLLAVVYIPVLQPLFGTRPIGAVHWLWVLALALLPLTAGEVSKNWKGKPL